MGLKKNIPVHVDACLGGFVFPFIKTSPYDFRVPGVTSLCADMHKYGLSSKGLSVLLFKHKKDRE